MAFIWDVKGRRMDKNIINKSIGKLLSRFFLTSKGPDMPNYFWLIHTPGKYRFWGFFNEIFERNNLRNFKKAKESKGLQKILRFWIPKNQPTIIP